SGRCVVTGVGGLEIPDLIVNVDSSHEFGVAMVDGQIAIAELEWPPNRARTDRDPRLVAAASAASELIVNAGGARIELVANPDGLPVRQYVVAWVPGQSTPQKEETP
ncbi:hypothetical protein, partial [Actinokineospora sp.]|uniref:hypothetical protein n=1 Tax=Actinokineospora sp. TaxID=1872133 RepID=UPI003D6B0228